MTADTIRKLLTDRASPDPGSAEYLRIVFVCEIAAHLAELNEKATKPELEKLRQELREEIVRWKSATDMLKQIESISMTTCNSETDLAVTLERIRHLFYKPK
jgi:hypothetical protein